MTGHFFVAYRKLRTVFIWLCACALALCSLLMLSACSEQKPTNNPSQSAASPSPSGAHGTWTAGMSATDWGTYSLASDAYGNFSAAFPSPPTEKVDEEGNLRLLVNTESSAEAQYMVLVEPLDDSEFAALTPMNDEEREGQLHWYALDFVGAEMFVANMQSAPYEGNVGVRYRATNFNAEVWTILVIDGEQGWVYSVCAYSHDAEPTPEEAEGTQRFLDSFRLIMT